MKPLRAYCMEWHVTVSPAFRELLVEPLAGLLEIELTAADPASGDRRDPAVFCQMQPPASFLNDPTSRPIWIPMWDNVASFEPAWWAALPRHLRIVAFSERVAERAEQAGLRTLRLQFFRDPEAQPAVQWDDGPVVFYWNRVGLVGPDFLASLCGAIGASKLIYMPDLDPGAAEALRYELPHSLGETAVEIVRRTSQAEYLRILSRMNVYVAPRQREGVGLTFVEAMSMGAATFAYDGAAMNEYIRHRRNGYLLKPRAAERLLRRPSKWPGDFALSSQRNWRKVSALDLRALGDQALRDHRNGFATWSESRERFARFLSEW